MNVFFRFLMILGTILCLLISTGNAGKFFSQRMELSPLVIKKIKVVGARYSDPNELKKSLEKFIGRTFFEIPSFRIKKYIKDPWIKSAHVEFRLPETLVLKVKEKKPMFIALVNDKPIVYDSSGKPVTLWEKTLGDLPIVSNIKKGDDIEKAYRILYTFDKAGLLPLVSEVRLPDTVYIVGGIVCRLSEGVDLEQVLKLKAALWYAQKRRLKVKYIELLGQNAVLKVSG